MIHDFWCLITFIFLSPNVVKLSLLCTVDFFFDRFKMDVVLRDFFVERIHKSPHLTACFVKKSKLDKWGYIRRKNNVRWQHLPRMKNVFLASFIIIFLQMKTEQAISWTSAATYKVM